MSDGRLKIANLQLNTVKTIRDTLKTFDEALDIKSVFAVFAVFATRNLGALRRFTCETCGVRKVGLTLECYGMHMHMG